MSLPSTARQVHRPRETTGILATALAYLSAGLSVIPVKTDGSKAPLFLGWREFSDRLPTTAELSQWFGNGRQVGIGIPGGPASGNLIVFDFEARLPFDRWCTNLTAAERIALAGSPVVFTPSGGVHIYLRTTEPVKGYKYARDVNGECLIETRGNGQFVVAPGSPLSCHATGHPYRLVRPGWIDGPSVEPIDLEIFHGLTVRAADLNEYRRPTAREVVGDRFIDAAGDRPGDHFNNRVSWADILEPKGWKVFRSSSGVTYWTRPGKVGGISASTGFCRGPSGNDLLYIFSTSAVPFEPEVSYSRFAAYVLLNHGGNFRAATRALGVAGYGQATASRKAVRR